MAESSETSLRDAQILDGDGTLANEAANKYLMKARAEAVNILQPECRVYGTANRQTASLQFLRTKCMTIRSDLRLRIYFHGMPCDVPCGYAGRS